MTFDPKTISDQIECLARLTGATDSFVCQVKALFTRKGIPLEADSSPYVKALEEAFRREESIRANSQRARESISALHQNFSKVGQAYVKQVEQLKKIQSNLREQTQKLRRDRRPGKPAPQSVRIKGDHRTYVTRQQRDGYPMVPGPKDVQ